MTIFGLCTVFCGYTVFSFLRNLQLSQSYRLSVLKEGGTEISPWADTIIDFMGYTSSDGLPIPNIPEAAAIMFIITFTTMVIAGDWINLSKSN